jgi:hypothetical protein
MPRLIFWRVLALITSGLLQVRVLLIILLLAYLVGWILGSVYGRGF